MGKGDNECGCGRMRNASMEMKGYEGNDKIRRLK